MSSGPAPLGPMAAKIVVGLLVAIGVAVIGGMAVLWPSHQAVDVPLPFQNAAGGAVTTESGRVVSSAQGPCGSPSAGGPARGTPRMTAATERSRPRTRRRSRQKGRAVGRCRARRTPPRPAPRRPWTWT